MTTSLAINQSHVIKLKFKGQLGSKENDKGRAPNKWRTHLWRTITFLHCVWI